MGISNPPVLFSRKATRRILRPKIFTMALRDIEPNVRLTRYCRQLSKFDSDVQYRNWLLNTQMDALFLFRSLEEKLLLPDEEIFTFLLHVDVTPTNCDGKGNLDDSLTLTTGFSLSFYPVTSDKIRFLQVLTTFVARCVLNFVTERGFLLRITAITSCFAPSTDLSKWSYSSLLSR